MSAAREKDQSDFDLEAFIDLFDEALTSEDPSVQQTLQHLMVIAALARNHAKHDRRNGPLRRMYDDQHEIIRRMDRLEHELRSGGGYRHGGYGPVPMPTYPPGITTTPWTNPTTTTQWPPNPGTYPPGTIFAQNLSGTSVTPPNSGAKSSTSYSWDPVVATNIAKKINSGTAGSAIAERVEDLLKDEKYKGSSLGTVDVKTA